MTGNATYKSSSRRRSSKDDKILRALKNDPDPVVQHYLARAKKTDAANMKLELMIDHLIRENQHFLS